MQKAQISERVATARKATVKSAKVNGAGTNAGKRVRGER